MEYLREVGPDTLVPCFTVNLKNNKSVEVCNKINLAIFQELSHSSGEQTAHRIPMVVTASSMLHHKHSSALKNFKKRLGVRSQLLQWLHILQLRFIPEMKNKNEPDYLYTFLIGYHVNVPDYFPNRFPSLPMICRRGSKGDSPANKKEIQLKSL